ncbi:MAG: 23S rRNA (uracil(1939)-C(5))-methyltransferase RlmD [Candidatus Omnitrophica bacterium]|nr:23S rRNA (uracil(1939)-C(5))-methyltransferase RlmD [Candidatus Omnitrophota bacterium]
MKEYQVEIKDLKFPQVLGIANLEGKTVFVPFVLPKEKVKVYLPERTKNLSLANLSQIERFSDFRTKPLCNHFGNCGGCSLQHLIYEEQLSLKENWLKEILSQALEELPSLEKITPSAFSYFYRNKMEFCFGQEESRLFLGLRKKNFGFQKPYRKEVVEIKECPIFSKLSTEIFRTVLEFLSPLGFRSFNPYTKKGSLRHLVLKEAKTTNQIMLILVTTSDCSFETEGLINLLIKKIPQIKSIWWTKTNRPCDVVDYQEKSLLYGEHFIEEKFEEFTFRIYPETFFQPNPIMAFIIYRKILENIETNTSVLSLYAGSGVLETFLSTKVSSIFGVDRDPQNIKTAQENFQLNKVKNCLFIQEKVEKVKNCLSQEKFDYAIIDPPRSGLTSKAIKSILKISPPQIIYLSCNPLSFARDLKNLKSAGYKIEKIVSFDFLPQTIYFESLGILKQ